MITIRKSEDRGHFVHGWLDTHHTFSFGNYQDQDHMAFRALRVINEDRVSADNGFGTHPHDNMEIISYVLSGELEHKDSMGNGSVIKAGEFQIISAGTGITHSEFNPSKTVDTHFYQIWILPDTKGLKANYDQKSFTNDNGDGNLRLVASKGGKNGSLLVNQDVNLYTSSLQTGERVKLPLTLKRHGWVQVVKGELELEGVTLQTSDGAAINSTSVPSIVASSNCEFLFFDLP